VIEEEGGNGVEVDDDKDERKREEWLCAKEDKM
jgi:hypothetical protein